MDSNPWGQEVVTGVKCYHIYIRSQDRYDFPVDLCDKHAKEYNAGEGCSLHDSGPVNRPCEMCDAQTTEE